ncbi:enolase-phosphatase E1 [Dipsacomyces acuminosporus]|nr:enolase-phosphatase E1 [Dipsacomyces acuminosporus]
MATGYDIVLLDIEGTTTPISFVHDELFPYVTRSVKEFLQTKWSDPVVQGHVLAIAKQANADAAAGNTLAVPIDLDSESEEEVRRKVLVNVEWQMKQDRKIGALKGLQGYMWKFGYENGELKGAVYDDAADAIKRWTDHGRRVYIYSSGSVQAQKLLFGYSDHGDMLKYFSGHYDTTTGQKIASSSYTKIAQDIGAEPERILFVSDNTKEIEAADKAGMQTVVSVRPGNAPLGQCAFAKSSNFLDIPL